VGKISGKQGINQLTVSISHSADYAIASVILVGNENAV
jgi:phosphopantetheinyl transferase (holo-ACP synthase)